MKTSYRVIVYLAGAACIISFLGVALSPDDLSKANLAETKGVVETVKEGGMKDIVITLSKHRGIYYINRGIERGLSVAGLRKQIAGKQVTISSVKPGFLSKLSPMTDIKRIAEISQNQNLIFSESHIIQ